MVAQHVYSSLTKADERKKNNNIFWEAWFHSLDKYNDVKLLSKFRFLQEYVLQMTEQLREDIENLNHIHALLTLLQVA